MGDLEAGSHGALVHQTFGDDKGPGFRMLPTLSCDPKYSRNTFFIVEIKLE